MNTPRFLLALTVLACTVSNLFTNLLVSPYRNLMGEWNWDWSNLWPRQMTTWLLALVGLLWLSLAFPLAFLTVTTFLLVTKPESKEKQEKVASEPVRVEFVPARNGHLGESWERMNGIYSR